MLVSEKKLSSADGVLLWPLSQGLCYQSAGAFQRLGARLLGVLRPGETNKLASTLPVKTFEISPDSDLGESFGEKINFRSLIWAPHPSLSWNEAPAQEEVDLVLKTVRHLCAMDNEFHPIFVVPQQTPRETLLALQDSSPRATILLAPMAFGFRDEALFSRSLDVLKRKASLLEKISKDPRISQPLQAVSFSDLAAHLIVVPQNETLFAKNVWVHGAEWTLLEWQEKFVQAFSSETSFAARIGARLSSEDAIPPPLLDRFFDRSNKTSPDSSADRLDFVVHSDSDFFPSPAPQLTRALSQHSRAYESYPELELVFTPGKSI